VRAAPAGALPARGWRLSQEDLTALALFALTALLILGSGWVSPGLGSWSQARAILVLSTFVMVVGFGQQIVILTGGLDLSVPAVLVVGAVLMFSHVGAAPADLLWGIPMVLAATAAIGAVNGLFIALLRVPPFIMTLALGMIVASATLGLTGGAPQGTVSPLLVAMFNRDWLGAPPVVYAMVLLTALALLLQRRTAFGRMVYAIGTNPQAAYIAGLPVRRVTVACYEISGAAAGAAGILMVGFSQGATLNSGDEILIPSIAAVVIGGTSILGGRGSYLGVAGGALLLTTFSTMISATGLAAGWRSVIYGGVILIALLTLQEDIRTWGARKLRAFGSTRRSGAIDSATTVKGKTS
jgi:ribose transport system permease protein